MSAGSGALDHPPRAPKKLTNGFPHQKRTISLKEMESSSNPSIFLRGYMLVFGGICFSNMAKFVTSISRLYDYCRCKLLNWENLSSIFAKERIMCFQTSR